VVTGFGIMDAPFTRAGLEALHRDPWGTGNAPHTSNDGTILAKEIPKSTYYAKHIAYLAEVRVVRLVARGATMTPEEECYPPFKEDMAKGKHPAQHEAAEHVGPRYGGRYGADYKDEGG